MAALASSQDLPAKPMMTVAVCCDKPIEHCKCSRARRAAKGTVEVEDTRGEYEMEDPAEAWIKLVEATRITQPMARDSAVRHQLFIAKNSHWTRGLWNDIAAGYESPGSDTEPFTMGGDADHGGDCAESEYGPGEDSL